jgi:hypothetical protein
LTAEPVNAGAPCPPRSTKTVPGTRKRIRLFWD